MYRSWYVYRYEDMNGLWDGLGIGMERSNGNL